MRKTILLALAATLAGSIASANEGTAQLAAQLGVDAAGYTLADLVKIDAARRDGETALVGTTGKDVLATSAGAAQYAAQLGLPAGDYSLNELIVIDEARAEGDRAGAAFYAAKANRTVGATDAARALAAAELAK